jgi:hypothetical protein
LRDGKRSTKTLREGKRSTKTLREGKRSTKTLREGQGLTFQCSCSLLIGSAAKNEQ